ncbi:MAG: hypothetical protein K6U74_14505 [Firmicutes bacterium]|nr:hypothetical protein [Bacillota bacterium]
MKVGAGGLQSQVMFELDAVRREGLLRTDHQARSALVPELNRNIPEGERLVRLVEQLNTAAALANYPFRFKIKQVKDRVGVYRYSPDEPGIEQEEAISPEELDRALRHLQPEGFLDESI